MFQSDLFGHVQRVGSWTEVVADVMEATNEADVPPYSSFNQLVTARIYGQLAAHEGLYTAIRASATDKEARAAFEAFLCRQPTVPSSETLGREVRRMLPEDQRKPNAGRRKAH